ncbi:hypothetical protein [Desulfobacula sp.]|uniref:hypothetical protein n=1 Tax=Desulfobacula sp. TaxID=2593537 RepID=UPI00262ADC7F|nr:hypothetical protein [Desulfobacula sp.]
MERIVTVKLLSSGETIEVSREKAQKILQNTYKDPIGGLVIDGKTNKVIHHLSSDVECICVLEKFLDGG